jgi:DNA-binding response OmpR family regulator
MPLNLDPRPAPAGIAVVDDDATIGMALSGWLHILDMPWRVHGSAEAFMAHLRDADDAPLLGGPGGAAPAIALRGAVLDINLPGMSGFALAHRLRSRYPQLTIVLITALDGTEIECLGPLPPEVVCLQKPFDLRALHALLFGNAERAKAGPGA